MELTVKKLSLYGTGIAVVALVLLATPTPIVSRIEKHATSVIVRQVVASGPYEGNTLIPDRDNNGVMEIDPNGEIVWRYNGTSADHPLVPISEALDVDRLKNGNTLITYYYRNMTGTPPQPAPGGYPSTVVEVTPAGEIVWEFSRPDMDFTHDSDRLPNGNTLIADTSEIIHNERVIEVTPDGEIVWEYRPGYDAYPNDCDRLVNGNTLISLRNRNTTIEVNPQGEIVWQYNGTGTIIRQHNPDRLYNGHTVMTDSENDRVIEIDMDGNIVWEYHGYNLPEPVGLDWCRDADRLPNGNTMITDSRNNRIVEINSEDELVWLFDIPVVRHGIPYEADRLNVPPEIEITSPVSGIQESEEIEIALSSPALDLDQMWYRVYDDEDDKWLDTANNTWTGAITRTFEHGEYTIYAWANDTGDWTQGDPNWSMTSDPAILRFIVEKKGIPGFESLGTLSSLAVLIIWWQKRRTRRKGSTFNV